MMADAVPLPGAFKDELAAPVAHAAQSLSAQACALMVSETRGSSVAAAASEALTAAPDPHPPQPKAPKAAASTKAIAPKTAAATRKSASKAASTLRTVSARASVRVKVKPAVPRRVAQKAKATSKVQATRTGIASSKTITISV